MGTWSKFGSNTLSASDQAILQRRTESRLPCMATCVTLNGVETCNYVTDAGVTVTSSSACPTVIQENALKKRTITLQRRGANVIILVGGANCEIGKSGGKYNAPFVRPSRGP